MAVKTGVRCRLLSCLGQALLYVNKHQAGDLCWATPAPYCNPWRDDRHVLARRKTPTKEEGLRARWTNLRGGSTFASGRLFCLARALWKGVNDGARRET